MSTTVEPSVETVIRQLLRQREGETLEFKRSVTDRSAIQRVLASFANTSGGNLIVGIEDQGAIVGCDLARVRRVVTDAAERLT